MGQSLVSVTDLGNGMLTVSQDAAGTFTATITDMAGNVVAQYGGMTAAVTEQTATLAADVPAKFAAMQQASLTSVTALGDGMMTTTQTASGAVISTITDMQGQVTSQYATLANGAQLTMSVCRAPALPDSALCWSHDPRQADAAAAARAAGASKGAKVKALHGRRRRLDSHGGLAAFLTALVHDVVEGKVDPDVARTAFYGCSILRQLAEHGLEKRLAEVERLLAQRRTG